jgi:hypothetical protein
MKLGIEEMYLNTIKAIFDKSMTSIILNKGNLKPLPLKVRNKTRMSTLSSPIQYSHGILSHRNKSGRRNKRNTNWTGSSQTIPYLQM